MITSIVGQKLDQGQKFLEDGQRVPVTHIKTSGNVVVVVKDVEKHGYTALQVGFGGSKKRGKSTTSRFLREIRLEGDTQALPKVGETLQALDIFKPGDIVNVTGVSKGKGFAGGVKRHHFKGGPRTHGQSDRERAPGSIGQTTTPGRVYKGKRMAGHMGAATSTIRNVKIVDVTPDEVVIAGLVPGITGGLLIIKKIGEMKKFVPLYKDELPISKEEEPTVNPEEKKE